MNFFGVGTLEVLVILLVAFVALGPGKTVEVAKTIGRMTREARRTFTDIMDAASLEERPSRRDDPERRPSSPTPPDEPLSSPSHLAEQTPTPSASDDAPGPGSGSPPNR